MPRRHQINIPCFSDPEVLKISLPAAPWRLFFPIFLLQWNDSGKIRSLRDSLKKTRLRNLHRRICRVPPTYAMQPVPRVSDRSVHSNLFSPVSDPHDSFLGHRQQSVNLFIFNFSKFGLYFFVFLIQMLCRKMMFDNLQGNARSPAMHVWIPESSALPSGKYETFPHTH